MSRVVSVLLASIFPWVQSRLSMQRECIALRHQLAVYKQSGTRPLLRPADRLFGVWRARLWSRWQQGLPVVQPRPIIAWQQKRCGAPWRRLSQSGTPGRPALAREARALLQDRWQSNPTWGSPRMVGELRNLGI